MNQHALRLPELENQKWEIRRQVTYIAPVKEAPLLAGLESKPPPRTNVVVSQGPVPREGQSARDAAEDFIEQTRQALPGLQRLSAEDWMFGGDQVQGYRVVIQFPATRDVWLEQHHYFRVDQEAGQAMLTQIVVTCDRDAGDPDVDIALQTVEKIGRSDLA